MKKLQFSLTLPSKGNDAKNYTIDEPKKLTLSPLQAILPASMKAKTIDQLISDQLIVSPNSSPLLSKSKVTPSSPSFTTHTATTEPSTEMSALVSLTQRSRRAMNRGAERPKGPRRIKCATRAQISRARADGEITQHLPRTRFNPRQSKTRVKLVESDHPKRHLRPKTDERRSSGKGHRKPGSKMRSTRLDLAGLEDLEFALSAIRIEQSINPIQDTALLSPRSCDSRDAGGETRSSQFSDGSDSCASLGDIINSAFKSLETHSYTEEPPKLSDILDEEQSWSDDIAVDEQALHRKDEAILAGPNNEFIIELDHALMPSLSLTFEVFKMLTAHRENRDSGKCVLVKRQISVANIRKRNKDKTGERQVARPPTPPRPGRRQTRFYV